MRRASMLRPQQAGAAARLARLRLLQQHHQQQQSHPLQGRAGQGAGTRASFATAGRDGGEPPASGGILSNMLKRWVFGRAMQRKDDDGRWRARCAVRGARARRAVAALCFGSS